MNKNELRAYLQGHANKNKWILQPSQIILNTRLAAMLKRLTADGKPVCPCKAYVNEELTPQSCCPCPEAVMDIQEKGQCHCRVFLRRD